MVEDDRYCAKRDENFRKLVLDIIIYILCSIEVVL